MKTSGCWMWVVGGVVVAGVTATLVATYHPGGLRPAVAAESPAAPPDGGAAPVHVEVVRPEPGGLQRVSVQPGTIMAFQSADLYSKVPGFLAEQAVDIGSRVKKGQELARIDVPEYERHVARDAAAVAQARAEVKQMEARVASAEADANAAEAGIASAVAALASATSTKTFREKQFQRFKSLLEQRSIDERLVDEKEEQRDAAVAAENAAKAAIITAKAQTAAAKAKVLQATADLEDARAKVEVATAELDRTKVYVAYSHIVSPYDGVVTKRNYFPGDLIVTGEGHAHQPILSVDRTDKLRAVIQVPDRDVPYANPGDEAVIEIDALPGRKYKGVISRTAECEDPLTRTMRVEVDLNNERAELRAGMYGRATIVLEKGAADAVTIPSVCLHSEGDGGKTAVYVVRDGKAVLVPVTTRTDTGVRCEVTSGLTPGDEVISGYSGNLGRNRPVVVIGGETAGSH